MRPVSPEEKPNPLQDANICSWLFCEDVLHYLWVGPLQAVTVTALLWMEIGMSCLAAMAVLIILLLLQSCFGMLFSSLWSKTTAFTDDRIRTMSEVITGIRTVKMYAWGQSFIDLITRLRRKDISKILRISYLRGMNLASCLAVSKIIIFVTFITNELLDNLITASQVFVVVMLFEALRFSSTPYFPMAIEKVSEAVVSIRRIKNFLLLDEIPQVSTQLPSEGEVMVDMQDFIAFWDEESETPTLQGLSFTVRPGELLAVVGPVGAGRSSLLRAVLEELPPSQGKFSVLGRIAYVSQQPWVFPGTVKSNILFGNKYEEEQYEEVIKACALEEDFQNLKERDLTVAGDGGTPLSEGQKALSASPEPCIRMQTSTSWTIRSAQWTQKSAGTCSNKYIMRNAGLEAALMALPSTCVAPCSVLPNLGVVVAGRSHRSRPRALLGCGRGA
ncbi:LOW QUALITY PROTEIN: multidrug resistance-associated protein 4-like [Bos indicus x Bos taurus]|uniref:LOW QUALITY PROTEIN: multidrug resistance-associated protein 4-like n=1 Tax=Bos indicus x Bos taurus TaxID=30522 RepID=UPI000F7D474C|nr:LOW QUALITY PROTEIN: multidrug resistance-associated protein 4-like [Bos indicus x Bos taurus]